MKRRKALLVGAGGMGRQWGKNLQAYAEVELVAWVDVRPDAAAQAIEEFGFSGVIVGSDLELAIAEAEPDFVVDVTIPEAHHEITLRALAAGLPVLGEKPMADTMEHARDMVSASERADLLYMVSQSRRYNAGLAALRRLIHEHTGPLGVLNADFYLAPHFGGFRESMDSPLVLDMAIHTFDAARYVSDTDPVAVYCEEFNPPWSWYAGNACASAVFEMTGGLRYTYRGSWCADGQGTSWDGAWRAVGPRGSATWDGLGAPMAETAVATEGFMSRTQPVAGVIGDEIIGIAGSLREFLHALDTGATPMGECHDNIKSLAMVFGAIESARSGRRVSIQDVIT